MERMKVCKTLLVLLVAACARPSVDEADTRSQEALGPRVAGAPTFGFLVTRHGTIAIKLSDQGPLYTVITKEGETLAQDVDEAYLVEYLPEIHQFVDETLAAGEILATGD